MSAQGHWKIQQVMLQRVADALGADLLREVAFVGGCSTGLLITDDASREAVRLTDDVDLIVPVMGPGSWYRLPRDLAGKGFRPSPETAVICRPRLLDGRPSNLVAPFMPVDAR